MGSPLAANSGEEKKGSPKEVGDLDLGDFVLGGFWQVSILQDLCHCSYEQAQVSCWMLHRKDGDEDHGRWEMLCKGRCGYNIHSPTYCVLPGC